jgi:hypothetical protein
LSRKPDHSALYWEWDEAACAMHPLPRFQERAKQQFADKGIYRLQVFDSRTTGSHNHYFASLNTAWKNLPENLSKRFPTMDHLRKWLLIKCGYCAVCTIACATEKDARALIASASRFDQHAVIMTAGTVVTILTAESQSAASMNKATFQSSKRAVLEEAAALIGSTADELMAHGNREPDYSDYEGYA